MIFSIGFVSAEEIAFDDSLSVSAEEIAFDDSLSVSSDEAISEDLSLGDEKTFKDLNDTVSQSAGNLNIEYNYTYNEETDSDFSIYGITIINKTDYVIEGNGNTIDGNGHTIFTFTNSNVTIQNLILKNMKLGLYIEGQSSITTYNVTFENSAATAAAVYNSRYSSSHDKFLDVHDMEGSAIYSSDSFVNVNNSTFMTDEIEWALIYGKGESPIEIINCEFKDLSSKYATVIYNSYSTSIRNCRFYNLESITAGAIGLKGGKDLAVEDCQFVNVSSAKNGGAIYADMNGNGRESYENVSITVKNSLFDNCSSGFGGAILQLGGSFSAIGSNFTNNIAGYVGGAIFTSDVINRIEGCLFENNTAVEDTFFLGAEGSGAELYGKFSSGAIYADNGEFTMKGSNFTGNSGAVGLYYNKYQITNCIFDGNQMAIKTMFDMLNSSQRNNVFNDDNVSFNNLNVNYNIAGRGMEIPLNPTIIDANTTDSSFDLRDYGLVTPVEDQGNMGSCWAFGGAGAFESAFLKATGIALNISENNIQKAIMAYSIYGNPDIVEGGYYFSPVSYFISYMGFLNESDDSYDEFGKVSYLMLNKDTYHVQNVLVIPIRNLSSNYQEIDQQLKEALIKYGAVTIFIFGSSLESEGYNKETFSQFYGAPDADGNHFVTLVGWDDNFSKDNFLPYNYTYTDEETGEEVSELIYVQNNGAWICKNSWGSDWGEDGYYYVSYEDTSFASNPSVAYIINDTALYNRVYQYDLPSMNFHYQGDTYKNYYDAEEDELISAVGTYFNETGVPYTISVFINDRVVYKQSGKSSHAGFETIKLLRPIAVNKGVNFAIQIKSNAVAVTDNVRQFFREGNSFDNYYGDLSDYFTTAIIKAYTNVNSHIVSKICYLTSNKFSINLGIANKTVQMEYDGKNYTVTTDSNGTAILNAALKLGDYGITVYFDGSSVLYPLHVFKSVELAKTSITVGFNTPINIDSFYYDFNDVPLNKKSITVILDKKTFNLPCNNKGYIDLSVTNLKIGNHKLTVINPVTNEKAICTIKVVSRFSGNKNIVMDYCNGSKYQVRVYGNNGKVVGAGQVVTFRVKGKNYKVKTNKNGWARLSIPNTLIPVKKYAVTATYKGQTVKNYITVKQVLRTSGVKVKKTAKSFALKATLKTSKKKAIRGKVIKFKFMGKTYKAKTNKNGLAKVTIKKAVIKKLKKGKTYKASVTYVRDTVKANVKVL